MIARSIETRARLACLFSGIVWGIFWIPLRGLETAGVSTAWGANVFFGVATVLVAPLAIWRFRSLLQGGAKLQITAVLAGTAMALYALSVLYTDVIRAILLFYLTPIWGFLLARFFLGEAIRPIRMLAMALALAGMLVILGLETGLPWPRNIGDWMGLLSGVLFSIAMVRLRLDETQSSLDMTVSYFFWCFIGTLVFATFVASAEMPAMPEITLTLYWLVPAIAILIIPGAFGAVWGPKFLNPGIAGLLFMTEIAVGAISAAIWADEPFGLRECIGILLIAGASLLEPLQHVMSRSQKT